MRDHLRNVSLCPHRNCLVSVNYTVKIATFGMNGDLYANDYFHVDNQLLPIRWMAWEAVALVHQLNHFNLWLIELTDASNQDETQCSKIFSLNLKIKFWLSRANIRREVTYGRSPCCSGRFWASLASSRSSRSVTTMSSICWWTIPVIQPPATQIRYFNWSSHGHPRALKALSKVSCPLRCEQVFDRN